MAKFGKWIGAGLGAFAFGPIGAIIGFIAGSAVDAQKEGVQNAYRRTAQRPTTGGYVTSLLVLAAAIMKADGKALKSELEYVRAFLTGNFGKESANEAVVILRDILKQNIPVNEVCWQIQRNMDYSSRLQLMHFLFGIAQADGDIHEQEIKLINQIGINLGINRNDYISIQSMFIKNIDSAYKILEIDPGASNDEVKKAYRRMAMKYHPDKVSYLGEEFQHAAKDKFQKLNIAYEEIKKKRNIA
jgi:DnaJ like chaperone protein